MAPCYARNRITQDSNLTKSALSSTEASCIIERIDQNEDPGFGMSHIVAKCCCKKPQDTLETTDREVLNIFVLLE